MSGDQEIGIERIEAAEATIAGAVGRSCDLFVPSDASVTKVEAARGLGAPIHTCEGSVDHCIQEAGACAEPV